MVSVGAYVKQKVFCILSIKPSVWNISVSVHLYYLPESPAGL